MNIIFFGSDSFSIPVLNKLLQEKFSVQKVVTTPDTKRGRGQKLMPSLVKEFATEKNLSIVAPNKLLNVQLVDELQSIEPDFLVIASYGKMVPPAIFKLPKHAALNVHPSLLPKYRGASPIASSILNGDRETGVSIAEITKDLDAGDVFGQISTPIRINETAAELTARLSEGAADLLVTVIRAIAKKQAVRKPQDDKLSTYASKLTKQIGKIEWSKNALQIHQLVRACQPWPSSFTFFKTRRLKIVQTLLVNDTAKHDPPGTILDISKDRGIIVQTGSGCIALMQVQLEGRREMLAYDFAVGQHLQKRERLETS
jgi:methionyl-tRNA formyltransferase